VNVSHTFVVEMPVAYKDASVESVVRLHEILQMEKPANTSYCLRFLAEARAVELREFLTIGVQSGIGVGHEVVLALAAAGGASEPESEEQEEHTVQMRPADLPRLGPGPKARGGLAPVIETVDEFIPPPRQRPPLPRAPRADDAPIEGQEVRTSLAGGFEQGAREMRAVSTRELEAVQLPDGDEGSEKPKAPDSPHSPHSKDEK
jgi:hypothetical protein